MRKLMRLDEAVEKKIVKNLDKFDPNALFPKRIEKVNLEPSYTGMDEQQEIYRQDFEWVFFKTRVKRDIKLSMLAVGKKENRSASVGLRGRTGYLWCTHCWREINKLYSNRGNGITAYELSEEELNFLFERNKKFKGFEFGTWLEDCFKELFPGGNLKADTTKSGVKVVRERTFFKQGLWFSTGHVLTGFFDYCPYIHIWGSNDIMVVLNSKKLEGKWKLIPRKGLLKWWYRLF